MSDTHSAWTAYWQAGHRHSCFSNGVPLPVVDIWEPLLTDLSLSPTRILDAACGGGALAAFMVEKYPDATIYAADAASWLPELSGVDVWPNTRLEQLPFDDDSFDLVVSQFGLEYASADEAIPEVARVLANHGVLVALMHHKDSAVVKAVVDERHSVAALLAKGGLLNVLHHLATAEQQRAPDIKAVETAAAQAFEGETKQLLTSTRNWVLSYIAEMMEHRSHQPSGYLAVNLQRLVVELSHAADRLEAMAGAVLDAAAMGDFSRAISKAGLGDTRLSVCHDSSGAVIGWLLIARQSG